MVELTLDLVEQACMPEDCYVSVRIGDSQKLSKLADSRLYRFPNVEKRYGRIEVFQRIGSCTVDVDPLSHVSRERPIGVNCQESGFGRLAFRVGVDADSAAKQKHLAETEAKSKKHSTKVKAAQEYLGKHGLEVMLSDAMQGVLRERPENPSEYIAKRLLGEEKVVEAPRTADTHGTESKRSLGRTQPFDQKPVEEKVCEAFGDYYRRNFRTLGADCVLPELYPHFPIPRTSHEMPRKLAQSAPRVDRQGACPGTPEYYQAYMAKACGDDHWAAFYQCSFKLQAPCDIRSPVPFGIYFKAHFRQNSGILWSSLHSKFCVSDINVPRLAEGTSPLMSVIWSLMPSVGTWLVLPVKRPASEKTTTPFAFHPSVGTWFMSLSTETGSVSRVPGKGTSISHDAASRPAVSNELLPSVGTWLTKPAKLASVTAEKPTTKVFLKPSVGTWFMLLPQVREDRR